jgi:hypothetical protein
MPRYTATESQLTISPPNVRQRQSAFLPLPAV